MIAIDGVAPQAKMCQQRTRRFMSAHTERLRRKIEAEVSCIKQTHYQEIFALTAQIQSRLLEARYARPKSMSAEAMLP